MVYLQKTNNYRYCAYEITSKLKPCDSFCPRQANRITLGLHRGNWHYLDAPHVGDDDDKVTALVRFAFLI